ncbi:D-alanyl-D-alanine carboxypeptidase/D-alanyl-D-alanine-endopeptidase [Algoriphagus namhaensis]
MKKAFAFIFAFLWTSFSFAQLDRDQFAKIESALGDRSFFAGHLTGFMLYDLDSQRVMYEKNSQLRFIPASTTKLFTLFASIAILGDSTQTLRYVSSGDTIKIWGSGDPTWRYKDFSHKKIEELIAPYQVVVYSDSNMDSPAFGYGWQWDDYYFDYSAERTTLPLRGNLLEVKKVNGAPRVYPERFQSNIEITKKTIRELERDFHSNTFYYNPGNFRGFERYIPLLTSPSLFVSLASEATGKKWIHTQEPLPAKHNQLRAFPLQPVLKEMMLESDNFLAEQLLLMVSDRLFQRLDTERAIEYILKSYLGDLPDVPQWVDGSGLSRHNLFTPRSMIALFEKLYRLVPDAQLFELLPTGGVSGTIENSYQAQTPYIFAKTGTMSNNHSLVGLLRAKSGKYYAFAFMNTNYPYKASEVRKEMEKVMVMVRDML